MPEQFHQTMTAVSEMIDSGQVDQQLLGDLELPEIFGEISGLVSSELMHLHGLSDDPEENEDKLRQVVQNAAVKAFFAGLAVGGERAVGLDSEVILAVPADQLEQIAIGAIRDGVLTIQMVAAASDSQE